MSEHSQTIFTVRNVEVVYKAEFNPDFWTEASFQKEEGQHIYNTNFSQDGIYYDIQLNFRESADKKLADYKKDYSLFLENFVLGN